MKLSKRSIEILKNLQSINPSLLFKEGNVQSTMATGKKIIAQANMAESMEKTFGIYELSRLINTLSLFSDPEIALGDARLTVSGEGRRVDYTYCEPEAIVQPPKGLNFEADASFDLPAKALDDLRKASGILSLNSFEFVSDGESVKIRVIDPKNSNTHAFTIDLGPCTVPFRMVFNTATFKQLPGDYKVEVSLKKIARFTGSDVTYYVVAEYAGAN